MLSYNSLRLLLMLCCCVMSRYVISTFYFRILVIDGIVGVTFPDTGFKRDYLLQLLIVFVAFKTYVFRSCYFCFLVELIHLI